MKDLTREDIKGIRDMTVGTCALSISCDPFKIRISNLIKRVKEIGLEIAIKPQMNIVCMKMKDADSVFSGLSDIGWKASVTRSPKCLRIVVMPHVTKMVVDEFVPDLEKVCKDLKEI